VKPSFFKIARQFERWLAKHHRRESLLLVGFQAVAPAKACRAARRIGPLHPFKR
jgi:hypothetical protein